MNDSTNSRDTDTTQAHAAQEGAALSRRRFVKRAIATAPILATLPTGAALAARSSNLIGATKVANSKDIYGRTLCLDRNSGQGLIAGGNAVDLGQPPSGRLSAIRERVYRVDDRYGAAEVSEATMCKNGGSYYYKSGWSWKKVTVPKGILVSATSLSSFTGSIIVTEL
jgi:hypothetical protein